MPKKLHRLKTWPQYFAPAAAGIKPFEVRKEDRGFSVGDHLALEEWDPKTGEYSGRYVEREITYIFTPVPGLANESRPVLQADYVVLGVVPVPFGASMIEDQRPAHMVSA